MASARGLNHTRHKVLFVDESSELRELYAVALEHFGYEIRTAPDAEEALPLVEAWRPDLVLTDLFLPGMSGLDFITRVTTELSPPSPIVVVISGFGELRDEAMRRGAARFVPKPLGHRDLLHVVAEALTPGLRSCSSR